MNAALADSVLNLTPIVGVIKGISEDDSLDVFEGAAATFGTITEIGAEQADVKANERLRKLGQMGRNRAEQKSLGQAIEHRRGASSALKIVGRAAFGLSLGVEAKKFKDAAAKCWCQAK